MSIFGTSEFRIITCIIWLQNKELTDFGSQNLLTVFEQREIENVGSLKYNFEFIGACCRDFFENRLESASFVVLSSYLQWIHLKIASLGKYHLFLLRLPL